MIEVIPAGLAGERIDRVVSMVARVSRAEATRMIDEGRVLLSGDVVGVRSRRVDQDEQLEILGAPDDGPGRIEADEAVSFDVVYSDDQIIVVDKPAGLVVHPGSGNLTGTLVNGIVARFPEVLGVGEPDRPGVVHRLDKGTSGLMLVARTSEAYERLVGQLSRREVARMYEAVVKGHLESPAGVIDAPIGRSSREPTKMCVSANGREARTHYRRVGSFTEPLESSSISCSLETGRTHQIRVHLAAIGHPVVGDQRYGGGAAGAVVGIDRPFLHAVGLRLEHPTTGEQLSFESPLAADLRAVLERLEAGSKGSGGAPA